MGRQDLSGLQTRKMKGLKRSRDVDEDGDVVMDAEVEIENGEPDSQRMRMDIE